MKEFIDEFGGEVRIYGTPAEENAGAKIPMAKAGLFDDVDAVMEVHPSCMDTDSWNTSAIDTLSVEFRGKPSHAAAAPEIGINALDAMILLFNAVGLMRQQTKEDIRIHGVITHGGSAVDNLHVGDIVRYRFHSIFITGISVSVAREILIMILYAICAILFCMIVRLMCKDIKILSTCMPIIVIGLLAVCPVFFDLNFLRPVQFALPTYYYLNCVYDNTFIIYTVIYMAILTAVYALLCKILKRI